MTTTFQRRFDFDLGQGRPLHTVSAIMGIFDISADDVLYLIEDGRFAWAFDIASPGAHARELRIWRNCLLLAKGGDMTGAGLDLQQVVDDILPKPTLPNVRASSLCRSFNCGSTHVHDLIRAGCLTEVADPDRGLTNTRLITRSSVVNFLAARRVR